MKYGYIKCITVQLFYDIKTLPRIYKIKYIVMHICVYYIINFNNI